jgi:hypothetical protein
MRRLVIFPSDPGKLMFIAGQGSRTLIQYRSTLTNHPGYCNNVANVVWSAHITEFGDTAQGKEIAHLQFEVYRNDRRKMQKLKSEAPFAGVDEGLVFEFDWLNKDGKFLCGNYTRETLFRIGGWMVLTAEDFWNETPVAGPYLAPRLAALLGGQQLTPSEVAFRNTLMGGLGLASKDARSCLDEVMNAAEADAAKTPGTAADIARLRDAAAKVHAIGVLAEVPAGPGYFEEFDPKWWDALKEVVPNPQSAPDPQESMTDKLIDELLKPPLSTVINLVRTGNKAMRAIKTHIVNPLAHRELYECYARQRSHEGSERVHDGMSQGDLEQAAVQVLLDATAAGCSYSNDFKNSYERELGKRTAQPRDDEYKRLLRPVATRFEFIYQVESAKAHKDELIKARWAPVADVLARLKTRVNACIAAR